MILYRTVYEYGYGHGYSSSRLRFNLPEMCMMAYQVRYTSAAALPLCYSDEKSRMKSRNGEWGPSSIRDYCSQSTVPGTVILYPGTVKPAQACQVANSPDD